jgi:pimeloyl-ACP methyl ester carboxylesterase
MTGIGCFTTPEGRARYFACYDEAIALLPQPREQTDVDTSYGQVRVYRHGPSHGSAILLLHGMAATSAMWEPNVAALAAAHPVYTLDTLGEPGRSVQSLPIRNGVAQAGWLDETLKALGLSGVHLVGVSAGGALAFNQAVHRPARVASVTLIEPAQVLARFSAKFLLAAVLRRLPGVRSVATDRFLSWVSGGSPMDTPIARLLAAGIREYQIRLPMPGYASDDVLRSVQLPVLALLGGRSVVHDSQRAAERARSLLPRGQAEVWPEASHSLSADAADRVNDRILHFVASMTEV